jgi:hypothetical protein
MVSSEGTCAAFYSAGRGLNAGGGFTGAMPLIQVAPVGEGTR